jgi:predicted DNA-binding transcriptional regulator AlpA
MRVLIFTDLRERGVRYSREHIRRREKAGTFPRHIELGEGRIGWFENEIDEWLARLGQARYDAEAQVLEITAARAAEPKAAAREWDQRRRTIDKKQRSTEKSAEQTITPAAKEPTR